ncbi:MAG: hypothetical protein WCO04_03210 [Pseudomonadota bacterium]
MVKYTQSDLQAMAALMNFGSTGQATGPRKFASAAIKYRPSDQEQFARLMSFDRPTAENAAAFEGYNAPVPPPRIGDGPSVDDVYTAQDQQSFDRIIMLIEDNSVFKRPNHPRTAADDLGQTYEPRDLEAFAALGGVAANAVDPSARPSDVKAAPRYRPPERPTRKDYFGIRIVDADAEFDKARQYFSTERPAMKIVFSDAIGKKW